MKRAFVFASALVAALACNKTEELPSRPEPSATSPAPSAAAVDAGEKETFVRITKVPPKVGDTRTQKQSIDMKVKIHVDMKPKPIDREMERVETSVEKHEALAVDGPAVTKVKIVVQERTQTEFDEGKQTKKNPSVTSGKTYIAEAKNGAIAVTNEKGGAVSKEEARLVEKQAPYLGKPNDLLKTLPEKIKVGASVPEIAAIMRSKLAANDPNDDSREVMAVRTVDVTLKGTRTEGGEEVAVFDVKTTLVRRDASEMTMDMNGEFTLRTRDGWPLLLSLRGPITMGNAGDADAGAADALDAGADALAVDAATAKGPKVSGTGEFKLEMLVSYP